MDTFLISCVILGLVKDEGGTETTKTKSKTKKDIDTFVLTEAKLKESFERVATSYHPEYPMFHQHNNTSVETVFRRILSSNHYLHTCLRHGFDTNQKASVYAEENQRFFNHRCFWDSRVDDDTFFIVGMTLFATTLKSIGLEKNDEIKSYIEKFCSQDDRDRAEKILMRDDAEWVKQKKRIIAEATEQALYIYIEAGNLVPLEVSDNDNDGAGADNDIETGEVTENNNNNNNGSSSSSSSSTTAAATTTTTTTAKTGNPKKRRKRINGGNKNSDSKWGNDDDDELPPPLIFRNDSEQRKNGGISSTICETKKSSRTIDTVNGGGKFDDDDRFKKRIGVKVLVHGLIGWSDLNGSIGTFMGRSPKTERKNDEVRYKINVTVTKETKLLVSCPNQIFLLKKDNFHFDDAEITDVSSDAFTHLYMKDLTILELEQYQQRAQAGNQNGITTPTVHVQEAPVRGSKGKKKNIEDPGGITTRIIHEPIKQKQPEGPRMIAATFKCPKNKTPGDVIEVINPHQLGQKIKVTIPKGTKPKKQFRVLVPLPGKKIEILSSCCICTKTLPKKEEDTHTIRAPLRVCDHLCCNSCHALIEGKICPKCSIPVPKHDTFKLLPFVQQLDNSESIIEAMLDEYFVYKESLRAIKDRTIKEALEEASEKTLRAVDKHYRRASLKVHPDRFGDKFRDEFERLTKARNILRDDTLRRSYLDEMIDISCKASLGLIPKSHSLWMANNDPDKKEQSRPETKKPEAGKKKATLRIDGGLVNSKPKRPIVNIRGRNNVSVFMPIVDRYQFQKYAQKVVVYGSCGNLSEAEIVLKEISIDNDPTAEFTTDDGGISTTVELSEEGVWDLYWNLIISFDDGVNLRETPKSDESRVDLSNGEQQAMMAEKDGLIVLAHRRRLLLKNIMKSQMPTERHQIEERCNELHHLIVKAIYIKKKLEEIVKIAKEKSCPSLDGLATAIRDAQIDKETIEGSMVKYEKRDVRKEFRRFLATQLERGMGEDLISAITREDLSNRGGDANRLFQLLIEGKKASSLAFNETVLAAAFGRDDLFTPKQRETLRDKITAISDASTKELELVIAEEVKNKKEYIERSLMEEKVKALGFGRGQHVIIHDLNSRADLNGSTGFYMGLGEGDRYIIKLTTGREVSLKKENFSVWDESNLHTFALHTSLAPPIFPLIPAPKPASVKAPLPKSVPVEAHASSAVAIIDVDAAIANLSNSRSNMQSARPTRKDSPVIEKWSSHDVHEKICRICLEETRLELLISPCDCKGSGRWVHWHCLNEWRTKNGELKTCGECLVEYYVDPQVTAAVKAATTTTVAKASAVTTKTETKKPSCTSSVIATSGSTSSSFPSKNAHSTNDYGACYTKKRRCYHEINCIHLRRSPDLCGFFHTEEEILFHHPNYRDQIPCDKKPAKTFKQTFTRETHSYAKAINNNDSLTTKTEKTASESSSVLPNSQELFIESTCVGLVLGKNHKNLVRIMSDTGSKIKILKNNTNGSILLKVSGTTSQSVDAAIKLMRTASYHGKNHLKFMPAPIPAPVPATSFAAWESPTLFASNNNNSTGAANSRMTDGINDSSNLNNNNNNSNNINSDININNNNTSSYQAVMATEDSTSILSGLTGEGDYSFLDSRNVAFGGTTNGCNVMTSILPPISSLLPSQQLQPPPFKPIVSQVISEGTGSVSRSAISSSFFSTQQLIQPQQSVEVPTPPAVPVAQTPPPLTVAAAAVSPIESNISNNNNNDDLAFTEFLVSKNDCFKVSPEIFHSWLVSQDIVSMDDLIDACEDDEFVSEEMRNGGLKAFKKKGFIKAVSTYNP